MRRFAHFVRLAKTHSIRIFFYFRVQTFIPFFVINEYLKDKCFFSKLSVYKNQILVKLIFVKLLIYYNNFPNDFFFRCKSCEHILLKFKIKKPCLKNDCNKSKAQQILVLPKNKYYISKNNEHSTQEFLSLICTQNFL